MAAVLVPSALLLATCMWQMDSPVKKLDGESNESWDDCSIELWFELGHNLVGDPQNLVPHRFSTNSSSQRIHKAWENLGMLAIFCCTSSMPKTCVWLDCMVVIYIIMGLLQLGEPRRVLFGCYCNWSGGRSQDEAGTPVRCIWWTNFYPSPRFVE